jgi:hypothetical protein
MSQKLYPACEDTDDHLDALIAIYVNLNRSKIKVPVARVYQNTYIVGTEVVHPYLKGGDKIMIAVEDIGSYIQRNQDR